MSNYTSPFGELVMAQIQTGGLLAINNTSGVWNSAGAQYLLITEDSLHLSPVEPKVPTNIKHGSASQLARVMARKSGQWTLNAPIGVSGTQAVPPDMDVLLQSVFGQAGSTQNSFGPWGNAWVYQIADRQSVPLTLLGFQRNMAATGNRFGLGCIPQRMTIDFNSNILSAALSGVCVGVVENESFSVMPETLPLGGLSTFPTIPGSYSATGTLINAFGGGTLKIGGQTFSNQCDNFALEFQTGQGLKGDFVDTAYPAAVIYGQRSAMATLGFVNNDSSQLAQLKAWGRTNTPVDLEFDLGTVAGSRMFVIVKGLQFTAATLSDANGYINASFGQSASSVTAGSSNDLVVGFA